MNRTTNPAATTPVIPLLIPGGKLTWDRCGSCRAGQGMRCVTPKGLLAASPHAGRATVKLFDGPQA